MEIKLSENYFRVIWSKTPPVLNERGVSTTQKTAAEDYFRVI